MDLSVYFITTQSHRYSHEEIAEAAVKGGVRTIQFRDKNMRGGEMLETAKNLKRLCDAHGATLMINDRVDIALACGADGVHVGQEDIPPGEVRRIFDGIVGVSVNNVEEALEAEKHANYLGAGPVFSTKTKEDARQPIGVEGLAKIVSAVSIPVVAIGSINLSNVSEIVGTGVAGIAVISAIANSHNPTDDAERLLKAVKGF